MLQSKILVVLKVFLKIAIFNLLPFMQSQQQWILPSLTILFYYGDREREREKMLPNLRRQAERILFKGKH